MADIKRKLSELLIDYADNNSADITPNRLRNGFKSVFGSTDVNIITSSTYQATPDDVVMIYNYENSIGYILIPAVSASDGTGDTYARKEYVVSNTSEFNVTLIDLGHSSEITTVEPGDFVYVAADSTNWNIIFKLQSSKFVHIDGSLPMTGTLKTPAVSATLIEFDTNVSQIPISAGQARWNPIDKTFDFGLEEGVTGQLFEEFFIGAHNETGETILNGRAVYVTSGIDDDQLHVAIASKDSALSKKTIAIATHDVASGQFAKFTKMGKIRDVDTSNVLPGRPIYLGLSGAFTSAEAVYPDYNILLGYCIIQHETSGVIYVDVEPENAIEDIYNVNITNPTEGDSFIFENNRWINRNFGRITKEATGFEDPYNVNVSYDETTRTITLTGANINSYWRSNATPISGTSWTSPPHAPGTSGNLFLYYNGTDFIWSSSPWSYDMLQIAFVNYDRHGKYILSLRECHGTMPWQAHEEFHAVVGTYLKTGGDLSNYTLNSTVVSARRPYIATTNVKDEDLETQNAALTSASYTRIGLSGTGYRFVTTDSSDIIALSGNNPMYDYFNGTTWNKALVTNNDYVCLFVVAIPTTSDIMSKKCRYVFVQPQKVFSTSAEAELYSSNDLSFGDASNLIPEYVFIGKIIIRYTAGDWRLIKVEKLSGSSRTQSSTVGNYLTTVTHDSSLSGVGTAASPLGIVSANIVHNSSLSGLGNINSPLGVVSATVYHDVTLSGNGSSASPLGVIVDTQSVTVLTDSTLSGNGSSASPLGIDMGFQDLNNMHSYNPVNGNTFVYVSAVSGWEPYGNIYALEYATTLFYSKYANWDMTYETMLTTSGNWQSTFTTVSANSAAWGGSATSDYIVSHTPAESAYQVSAIAVVSALPATQLPNVLYFLMS